MSLLNKPNLEYIKNLYTNRRLKKIVNVYQQTYINIKGQGFGDFLRGSIYLTYICIILGLEFEIDLTNHPISEYLSYKGSPGNVLYSNIEAFIDYYNNLENEQHFILKFIKKLNQHNEETYYLFNNFKPLFKIENPKFNIIQKARDIIIPKIEPINLVLDQLDNKLNLNNIKRNQYAVIQIRCGDFFMNIKKNIDSEKHQISLKHINDIITYINQCTHKKKKYILIGDSNKIKKYVASKFTNIITFDSKITHLGEDVNINKNAIIDTLIDFNIMRFSNFIISFTAYGHGSGFSKYCSILYNIGFKQILLKPTLSYNV
jgi:hypothetical protein